MKSWWCLILFFSFSWLASAQRDSTTIQPKNPTPRIKEKEYYLDPKPWRRDTVRHLIDSTVYNNRREEQFFDSLQKRLDKSKTWRLLNEYFLRDNEVERESKSDFVESEDYFDRFEGKTIEEISFVEIDVVEGSVKDSSKHIDTWLGEILDKTHTYTHKHVLRKSLIISTGNKVEPYRIADNERIIRSLPYIADAKTYVVPLESDTTKVRVAIFVQDRYSLGSDGAPVGLNHYWGEAYELNFLGTGNEVRFRTEYNGSLPQEWGFNPRLRFNNIFGSFINGELEYANSYQLEQFRSYFSKDFIAPQIKWVGGLTLLNTQTIYRQNRFTIPDSLEFAYSYHSRTNDLWLGRAFLLNGNQRRNNIAFSVRDYHKFYMERPYVALDSNKAFHNYDLLLGSVTLLRTLFFKTKKLYQFGVSEDIPRGFRLSLTGGMDFHEFEKRPYAGASVWAAHYLDNFGYVSLRAETGSYFTNGKYQDWVSNIRIRYFTKLFKLGKYDFRQFLSFYYSRIRHLSYIQDRVIFNNYIRGLEDFIDDPSEMMVLSLEPVFFAPWNFIGFRFALYGFYDIGLINSQVNTQNFKNYYSAAGVGFRIRNDNLALNVIQFRLAYYFNIPTGITPYGYEFSTSNPNYYNASNLLRPDVVRFGQ